MKHEAQHPESLLKALQEDGPSDADRARVRAKLLAAGLAVGGAGATVAASGTAAAATAATSGSSIAGAGSAGAASASGATAGAAGAAATATTGSLGTATAATAAKVGLLGKLAAVPAAVKVVAGTGVVIAGATLGLPAAAPAPQARPTATATVNSEPTPEPARPEVRSKPATRPTAIELPALTQDPAPGAMPVTRAVQRVEPTPPIRRSAPARMRVAPAREAAPMSTLAAEARLIEGALSAMHAGDPARATHLLDEHARNFPRGLLARERESARSKIDLIQDTRLNKEGADDNGN